MLKIRKRLYQELVYKIKSIEDLDTIMQVISDDWSYFPHRTLGGKCPKEMVQKYEIESILKVDIQKHRPEVPILDIL